MNRPVPAIDAALPPATLSGRWLLALYSIVPACLLFVLADWLITGGRLSSALPADPHSMRWFTLFFMLPHIFASMLILADTRYIQFYRCRLSMTVPLFLLAAIWLPSVLGWTAFMIVIAIYTIYHLMAQQAGMAAMLAENRCIRHRIWGWTSFIFLAVLYLLVLVPASVVMPWLDAVLAALAAALVVTTWQAWSRSHTGSGRRYIGANSAMLLSCLLFYYLALPFFLILMPRVVHDITAFMVYAAHNTSRANHGAGSVMGLIQRLIPLPATYLTPLAGIGLTVMVTYLWQSHMMVLLPFMALFHYHWEAVMWRGGSPLRQHIVLSRPA